MPDSRTCDAEASEALFLANLDLVEQVIAFIASRYHLTAFDADDFASHVKLKLVESDYAIFKKFQGRCSLRSYLTIVMNRLFLDYRTSSWGKWRPSADARRGGPALVLLEQLLVRDGYTFEQACELLRTNHRVALDTPTLSRMAAALPARTRRRFESEDVLMNVPAPERGADEQLADRQHQADVSQLFETLNQAMAELDPQSRLIVALRFEDGRTVAEIAALLRLDQRALYRQFERVLKEVRAVLEKRGVNASLIRELLNISSAESDWPSIGWKS